MKETIELHRVTGYLQEVERQPDVEQQPSLLGKHFHFPGNVLQTAGPENSLYKIACSIHAQVIDTTDQAMVDACIKFAQAAEMTDIYLLDRDLVKEALLEKAARLRNGDGLRWIDDYGSSKCPVCGFSCNDEYYLGKGNFCPDCGTRLLGLRNIMEGNP